MWKIFVVISSLVLQIICGELIGDNICSTEESYTENVTEPYIRNVTVRKYEWCMNVPPRCSYYTTREINDTRIVEKTYTNTIPKCCPGFYEKKNQCLPYCENNCVNGICLVDICICLHGFKGEKCDSRCPSGSWGSNCTENCNCGSQICNPFNGNCSNDENVYKEDGIMDTSEEINTNIDENTSSDITFPVSGDDNDNIDSIKISNDSKEFVYDYNLLNTSTNEGTDNNNKTKASDDINNISTLPDISTLPTFADSQNRSIVRMLYKPALSNSSVPEVVKISPKSRSENIRYNTENDFLINENREFLIPVQIKYDNEIARPLIKNEEITTTNSNNLKEVDSNHAILPDGSHLINTVSISAATTTAIVILAIVILSILQIRKSKRRIKEVANTKKSVGVSTVAVYTTSIFHTPLPDPPTYDENSSYLTPTEYQNCSNELKSFQTHIVCNMSKPNSVKNYKDYIYDHPPSTGSYRAASLIDPLDIDVNSASTIVQTEPVYDEIPCRRIEHLEETSYYSQPKSVYMNTIGRTKF